MVDFQVFLVCSIASIISFYVLTRSVPHKVSNIAYSLSFRISLHAESQLDHIPVVGYSGRLTSYLGALRCFRKSREVVIEGYKKVRFIPVNAVFATFPSYAFCSTPMASFECLFYLSGSSAALVHNSSKKFGKPVTTNSAFPHRSMRCSLFRCRKLNIVDHSCLLDASGPIHNRSGHS